MISPAYNKALRGLNPEHFLAEYWQKKPLLIRQAWPGFSSPISPEELAGLACEDGVNARLVQGYGKRWRVRHGPFQSSDFTALSDTCWTVLVPDIEKHLPELQFILEPFRFIPDWRIDDLMVSYAAPQGSVGPHADAYDVFLLQGLGHRRWQINTRPSEPDNVLPDSELRLLREFTPEHDWVLAPGDMLYLPPGIAHYGLALEPCMTFSIGFRAPTIQDIVADFCDVLIQRSASAGHLRDPKLVATCQPGEIGHDSLQRVQALLQHYLRFDRQDIQQWFGRFITESHPELAPEPLICPLTEDQLERYLAQSSCWQRHTAVRFAYTVEPSGAITVFIDSQMYFLTADSAWLGTLICNHVLYQKEQLDAALEETPTRAHLLEWLNRAYLLPAQHD